MSNLRRMMMAGTAPIVPVEISFIGNHKEGPTATYSKTFTSKSIGAASADRIVVIAVTSFGANAQPSTVTIAGNSMTMRVQTNSNQRQVEIYTYPLTTGTTATFVVNVTPTNTNWVHLGIWRMLYASEVPTYTESDLTGTTALNWSAEVPAGGVVVGAAYGTATNPTNKTWTELTERWEDGITGNNNEWTGADKSYATSQSGLAITADGWSNTNQGGVIAVFGPA